MKNVLITGATGGIGGELVSIFYKNGYNICATGTNRDKLNHLTKIYKERIKCISCNLDENDEVLKLVSCSKEFYGSTNILINNAGITKDNLFLRMKDDEWKKVINLNLNANFNLTQLILKDMIKSKWGRIINITSDAAKIGNPGQANYVTSKAAIEGMSRTIANEVASRGITVNCVSPGFVKTDIIESINKDRLETMIEKIPMKRIGTVNEISSLVFYLSSEESSYITGQVIHVNGGLTM
tara:strand:- start:1201 stop:1920 length:720 start_codon:yes stop_codon:yes gene_type:complete